MQKLIKIMALSALFCGLQAGNSTPTHNLLKPWTWNGQFTGTVINSMVIASALLDQYQHENPSMVLDLGITAILLSRTHMNSDRVIRPIDYARNGLGIVKIAYSLGKQIKPFKNLLSSTTTTL